MQSDGGELCIAWHPDGKSLAVAGGDRIIRIWDVTTRKQIARLEGHKAGGIGCAFNHAGDLLASGGWDATLRLWDPRTGQQLFQTQSWTDPRFSPDDRLLACGGGGNKLWLWEVAAALCYRTLGRDPVLGKGGYFTSAIHPDGRILAVGMKNEADLWDLGTGNHLAVIPLAPGISHVLFEPSGALLTNGRDGLRRWPVRADPDSVERLRIGPPQTLLVPGSDCHVACSRDGRVIAIAQYEGGLVLHADRPDQPVRLGPHDDARYIAVSPDGRWVATGSHTGTGVKVWDAPSGKLEKELPQKMARGSASAPTANGWRPPAGGCRLWAVGSGSRERQDRRRPAVWIFPRRQVAGGGNGLRGGAAGRSGHGPGIRPAGRPRPGPRLSAMSFTPDGTQLVATSNDSHSVHVWDLRAIRKQLAQHGAGLGPAGLPAAEARSPAAAPGSGGPRRIEAVRGGPTRDVAAGHRPPSPRAGGESERRPGV